MQISIVLKQYCLKGLESPFKNRVKVRDQTLPIAPIHLTNISRTTLFQVSRREDITDLLHMHEYIDLVIPRGSKQLVQQIQANSLHIPVLGHSEGICHVYIDEDVDPEMALRIGQWALDVIYVYDWACDLSSQIKSKYFDRPSFSSYTKVSIM